MAALFGPRTGEPAALVPLGSQPLADAFVFAQTEGARPMGIDPASGWLIISAPEPDGLLRAISSGFVPVTAVITGCSELSERRQA
jgi:hypothetical protein